MSRFAPAGIPLALLLFAAACAKGRDEYARAPDSAVRQSSAEPRRTLVEFAGYPEPTYLPAGFKLFREEAQPADGFHKVERFGRDVPQVALIYSGPPVTGASDGMRYPVKYIVTKDSGRLAGTERQPGTPVLIRLANGDSTVATYWDGMWAPRREYDSSGRAVPPRDATPVWSREIFHALMFRWREYTIGIRASHLNGVSREELLKIASSTAVR